MIDTGFYSQIPARTPLPFDGLPYDPKKARIKDILWKHYRWIVSLDKEGYARPCVLDNVQKALLCNTTYLGYDVFECPNCGKEMVFCRKCHSRF